jgi:hypothetical protein
MSHPLHWAIYSREHKRTTCDRLARPTKNALIPSWSAPIATTTHAESDGTFAHRLIRLSFSAMAGQQAASATYTRTPIA